MKFDLLDPLLSDNQCQVHSIFLLNTLLKCYRYDDRWYDINRLDDNDVAILADAVLLTSIKIKQSDGFGLVVRQESLEHFGGYLDSRKTESRFIAQIKENFNSKSVDFMRKIAAKSVSRILNDCSASIPHSKIKLKILPCYATVYALIAHIKIKRLPILIALKRIEIHSEIKYKVNRMDIYYYKWNGMKFQFIEKLDECEMNEPCVTFDSYSLYNVETSSANCKYEMYADGSTYPSHSFFINCDIGHMIMASLATHFQLSESKDLTLNPGFNTSDDYIRSIYKTASTESTEQSYSVESLFETNGVNVYEEYLAHHRLAVDFNGENSQYATYHKSVVTRRSQNAFFSVRHAHVSNYLNEQAKKVSCNCEIELGRHDFFSANTKSERDAVTLHILRKLVLDS